MMLAYLFHPPHRSYKQKGSTILGRSRQSWLWLRGNLWDFVNQLRKEIWRQWDWWVYQIHEGASAIDFKNKKSDLPSSTLCLCLENVGLYHCSIPFSLVLRNIMLKIYKIDMNEDELANRFNWTAYRLKYKWIHRSFILYNCGRLL